MASARDIIPIVLAGLGGALGGRQTAGAITNAAQISRAGRLDKQRKEYLEQSNARSARSLELSKEAAVRAEKGLKVTMDRAALDKERHEQTMKEKREAEAHINSWRANWKESHPDAEQRWHVLADLVKSPYEAQRMDDEYVQETNAPSMAEAKLRSEDLGPGESISFIMDDGGRFTARGLAEGSGSQIPSWKINDKIHDGQREYEKAVSDARMEMAQYQDKTDRILESQEGDGSREAHERLAEQVRLKRVYEGLIRPGAEWKFIQGSVGGLGIGDSGMSQLRQGYEAMQQAEAEARLQPPNATGDPAVNAAYDSMFGGQAPPLQPSHTPRSDFLADTGSPLIPDEEQVRIPRTFMRGR